MEVFKRVVAPILISALMLSYLGQITLAATVVNLGVAADFAVLAGSGITNTGATTINGDIGSFPTTTQTGFGSVTINGTNHTGDTTTQNAKTQLVTSYNDAAAQLPDTLVSADLGGQTLTPGTYRDNGAPASLSITGALTLDGGGNPNAVFVFQSASTLVTAAGSSVNLINGAQACNIFWQLGSSATLGSNSAFVGTIIALTSISLTTGATINGRALARNGAVTMQSNTITNSACGSLADTAGGDTEKQLIPWNLVIVGLIGLSTASIVLTSAQKRRNKTTN